ncbi:MAG: E2/UBC family protein [Actinomycetota bacterium]
MPSAELAARLDEEEPLLVEAYPNATVDRDSLLVVVTDHHLPDGWNHQVTDVAFVIPANYPSGQPDNVLARPDLRLANGELPGGNQGVQRHGGRNFLQFSWHIEPSDWRPTNHPHTGSSLATYLDGAIARFDEAS